MCLKALGEWGEEWGEGIFREFGIYMYGTWNSAQYSKKSLNGKKFEKEYIHVYV